MRAELPWNVAGIPPEAREAARAAARREGLSVGEWLTRRILRSFSDLGEEREAMPSLDRTNLDAWGLPQSSASRRDTEEMLARVSRSENESGDAYRRIEDQLRGVARRLDSSERSQSESNRVLSKTAAEMNIAAREQTQAFDQLGQSVMAISERLEALERARAQDGLKDAVKGLHQGLTRLADQVSTTANQSASQISMVAGNLDQVATRLAEVRSDSENSAKTLDERLSAVERLAHSGAGAIDHAVARLEQNLEQRLGLIEKSTGDVIGRGIERLEQRLGLVEKANGETVSPGLERLEQRLGLVERHAGEIVAPGLDKLEQRLDQIEHTAAEMVDAGLARLEQRLGQVEKSADEPPAALDHVEQRLGAVEKSAQVATGAIEHALDKLDSHANDRAGDRAEFERHAGHTHDALARLEEWMGRLEQRATGPAADSETGGRLDNIEKALTELVAQLEHGHSATVLEEGLHELAGRIEALEESQTAPVQHAAPQHAAPQPVQQIAAPQAAEPAPAFPADEPPAEALPRYADALAPPPETRTEPDHESFSPPQFSEPAFAVANETPPFAEEPHGFGEPHSDFADIGLTPGPDFSGHFSEPFSHPDLVATDPDSATSETFLSVARRSAREASERAESEKRGRLGGFAWPAPANDAAEKPRPRFLVLGVFGAVLVLVLAAGLVLSQRLRPQPADVARTFPSARPPAPVVPALTVAKPTLPPLPAFPQPAPDKRVTVAKVKPPIPAVKLTKTINLDRVTQLANAGNATAETIMGLRYLDGTGGTAPNSTEAARWLGQAANKGQPVAQYRYGTLLERGQGVAADPVKAAHLYLAAANQGNRKAMHNLAVSFAEGVGGRKDMAEAARWFSKAAGLGLSDSQFNLAVLYERGDGVPQSLLDAYKWYAVAAAQGDTESRQRLSVLQTQLGNADRAAAQRAAASFHAVALNRAANIPPETGDLAN